MPSALPWQREILKDRNKEETKKETHMTIVDGIRRVAVLLTVITAVAIIWNEKPLFDLVYDIDGPGRPPVLAASCDDKVHGAYVIPRKTDDGRPYRLILCFLAGKSTEGVMLVEYRTAEGHLRMNTPHSAEVQQYMQRTAARFAQTPDELLAAKTGVHEQRRSRLIAGATITLAALLFSWLCIGMIGPMIKNRVR
ncbi:hypothetical protein [Massilia aquatica]|uniref:Transmembrane protein n=1 Tax=Massilia aquatica TaxID=2609000 RepID=A0ABX0MB09_9BURK|nr:hypothetical protein [Massilia aquatica]NHZ39291.1 hypothetical protein [Massilia aquatica]